MNDPLRMLIVDDEPAARTVLKYLVEMCCPEDEVVGEAGSSSTINICKGSFIGFRFEDRNGDFDRGPTGRAIRIFWIGWLLSSWIPVGTCSTC